MRRIKGSALLLHREGPSVWADVDGAPVKIAARAVILATGGMQGVYEFTDTPQNLLGDGQSMALEAGAELVDMEFIQFYPLAVNEEGAPAIFLYPDYPSTAKLVASDGEDLILKHMGPGQSALAALHNWDFLSFIIQSEIIEGREVSSTSAKPRTPNGRRLADRDLPVQTRAGLPRTPGADLALVALHHRRACGWTPTGRPRSPASMRWARWPAA